MATSVQRSVCATWQKPKVARLAFVCESGWQLACGRKARVLEKGSALVQSANKTCSNPANSVLRSAYLAFGLLTRVRTYSLGPVCLRLLVACFACGLWVPVQHFCAANPAGPVPHFLSRSQSRSLAMTEAPDLDKVNVVLRRSARKRRAGWNETIEMSVRASRSRGDSAKIPVSNLGGRPSHKKKKQLEEKASSKQ